MHNFNIPSSLSRRFFDHQKKNDLIKKGDRILLALSGGKDSVCLFYLLLELKDELGISFGACHVHHGIRGEEADRDLTFCKEICQKNSIEFHSRHVSVPQFCSENKLGTEEGARILRYRVLNEIADEFGYDTIATAHTASDQAETVLFRLIRGTGVVGCTGILKRSGRIIRPLLSFSCEDILAYLQNDHRLFTSDSTNNAMMYARNRIRKKILPEAKEINPNVTASLCHFADTAASHAALCEEICLSIEKEMEFSFSEGEAPISLLRRLTKSPGGEAVLHYALTKMTQHKISIDFERFSTLVSLLNQNSSGKIIEIQKGCSFSFQKERLVFISENRPAVLVPFRVELTKRANLLPEINAQLTVSDRKKGKAENINKKLLIIHLSSDRIKGMMFARNYLQGDRIRMNGMTKSVKKLLCDAGFSREQRVMIPIICDDEGILWIPGIGLSDRARPEEAEYHQTLSLNYFNENNQ